MTTDCPNPDAEKAALAEALAPLIGLLKVSWAHTKMPTGCSRSVRRAETALADLSSAAKEILTECEELRHIHELLGMDGMELEKTLDEATGLLDWTGTPLGVMFNALLEKAQAHDDMKAENERLRLELISCQVFLAAPATKAERTAKKRSIDAALKEPE